MRSEKKMKTAFCFLVLVFFLSSAAKADDPEKGKFYVFGGAGVSLQNNLLISIIPGAYEITAEFKPGIGVSGGLGFSLPNNCRIESEIHWATNRMDDGRATILFYGVHFLRLEGDIRSIRGMLTAWIDLPAKKGWGFSLGTGVGMANVRLGKVYQWTEPVVPDPVSVKTPLANGSDWTFCYQLAAGVSYQLKPHVRLELCGRYLGLAKAWIADWNSPEYIPDSFPVNAGAFGIEIRIVKWL
jgi:opacity protein-like surface antigen